MFFGRENSGVSYFGTCVFCGLCDATVRRLLAFDFSGGSSDLFRSPRAVVWRKRSGRWQELHLPWCGRFSNRLYWQLRGQSRQLPDPTSWLCAQVPVERSDLQRPLLSGQSPLGSSLWYCSVESVLSLTLVFSCRCTSRHRELQASVYPSAEMNILTLLWYWEGSTARGRCLSSTSPFWWWARVTPCTGVDLHPERSFSPSSTLTSE